MIMLILRRLWSFVMRNKLDTFVVSILIIGATAVSGINMSNYPQRFEDEGTYISQAWAINERSALAHYTYWYDHPPAGWIQIAAFLQATQGIERQESAITAGREMMLFTHIMCVILLYSIARRLKIGTLATAVGVAAYSLSPLTIEFSRYLLLDNVALPWLLGAYLLALHPKQHIVRAVLSAVFFAIAVLSKETFFVLLPVLLYTFWQFGDKRNRRFILLAFVTVFSLICGLYVLYAALKNEFIPGQDHVSLLGTIYWQIAGRDGGGSVFDATSSNRGLIEFWLDIDKWLIGAGLLSVPFGLFIKNARIVSLSLLINLALLLRTGWLPFMFIIILLPFASLTLAAVLDTLVIQPFKSRRVSPLIRVHAGAVLIVVTGVIGMYIYPAWSQRIEVITSQQSDRSSRRAVAWVEQNVARTERIVVESAFWTDLVERDFTAKEPVWLYKTETDPEIVEQIGDWRGIDYVMLNGPTVGSPQFKKDFPTTFEAIENGTLLQEFGSGIENVKIYKINN